jgi:protein transport protein SEC24
VSSARPQYPLVPTNLVGLQPDVLNLDEAPPAIRLAPNASVTESAAAIPDHSYMRSTLNAVPTTNAVLAKSKLPFALVISPYRTAKNADVRLDPVAFASRAVLLTR